MKWSIALTLVASLVSVSLAAEKAAVAAVPASVPEPELEGTVVARSDGTFMTATMDGPTLVLKFFDKEKKQVVADVDRAAVRFQFPSRNGERRVLNRSDDGLTLSGGRPLKGPFIFQAFITLLRGEDSEGESYVVNYP